MRTETWPSDWLRAILPTATLAVLQAGPSYGYAIATDLAAAGLGAVKGGTLYPLLARLEAAGLVTTRWEPGDGGPGRKYFELTAAGHAELVHTSTLWQQFCRVSSTMLGVQHEADQ